MVGVLPKWFCSSCGGHHVICIERIEQAAGELYEYICPATEETVSLIIARGSWERTDTVCPLSSIQAVEVSA